jgi:hypothetical protein
MNELPQRMVDETKKPGANSVSRWIGPNNYKRWTNIIRFIESNYPDIFETRWWFGGKKFGWALRFKKSKSFCNLIPEKNCFKILLVFGAEERKKVEAILPELKSHVQDDYNAAKTFFDGKWVSIVVDSEKVISDLERLMKIKRRPKNP